MTEVSHFLLYDATTLSSHKLPESFFTITMTIISSFNVRFRLQFYIICQSLNCHLIRSIAIVVTALLYVSSGKLMDWLPISFVDVVVFYV